MTVVHRPSLRGRGGGIPTGIPLPGLRAALGSFSVAVAISAVLAIRDTVTWRTTYGGGSPEAALADLAAGLGLIGAGLYVGAERAGRQLASLLLVAGAAWLSADLVGWQGAPLQLRMVALVGALFSTPLLLHIVLLAPGRRPVSKRSPVIVAVAYLLAAGIGLGLLLLRDPSSETGCWNICSSNPFQFAVWPAAVSVLTPAALTLTALGGAGILLVALWRLAIASPLGRRSLWPILLTSIMVGAAIATRAVSVAWRGIEGPTDAPAMALFLVSAWAVAALAAGIAVVTRRDRIIRSAIGTMAIAGDGSSAPRTVARVLSQATGDRALRVAYPLSSPKRFIDASGMPTAEPAIDAGRTVTSVARGGETIAVISHDPDLLEPAELTEHLGAAALLALENERLDAENLAQLRELRDSRARIVEAGDRERQRRERDLHDGAQQRLLALTYDLRRARAGADDAGAEARTHLDAAIVAVHAAHHELRELAHGIYPAVLAEAGLAVALESLVERSPIPTRLEVRDVMGCHANTQMAAYVIADELIRDAARRGASQARVRLTIEGGQLVLEVCDDGGAPDAPIVHGEDRAGAAGGRLTLAADTDGEVAMRLEIPCAWS